MRSLVVALVAARIVLAACPYLTGELDPRSDETADINVHHRLQSDRPNPDAAADTEEFLQQFYLADNDTFMTTDVGGPIEEQQSLSVGERGSTLLEDFIFRQKIQRFDHERVCAKLMLPSGVHIMAIDTCNRSPNVLSMLVERVR